jgi:hypothetical protein
MVPCNLCGELIEIRWVNGRRTPIHGFRACGGARGGVSQRRRFEVTESTCRLTRCEHCKRDVFFIRHNGGSVWLDPPLGYPWIKHACMYPEEVRAGRSLALVSLPRNKASRGLLLAVVIQAKYGLTKKSTTLQLASGEADRWSAIVKDDRQFLLGELVIIDRTARTVTRFDMPHFPDHLLIFRSLT